MNPTQFDVLLSKLNKISELKKDHFAYKYCVNRGVEESRMSDFYFVPCLSNIVKNLNNDLEFYTHTKYSPKDKSPLEWRVLLEKYNRKPQLELIDSFIAIPSRDLKNQIIDLTFRRIKDNIKLPRFYSILCNGKYSYCFGSELVDFTKPFYAVEGFFDSCVLENSVSYHGFYNITDFLEKTWATDFKNEEINIVLDHEIDSYQQLIKLRWLNSKRYSLCLFPISYLREDLSEMYQRGLTKEEILLLVKKYSTKPGIKQNLKILLRSLVYYAIFIKEVIKSKIGKYRYRKFIVS